MAVIKIVPMPGAKGDKGDDGATGAQGPQGPIGATGPAGADAAWYYNGAYNPGASYVVGDVVTYDGQTWYRKNANGGNVGDTPSVGPFWDLVAAKGESADIGVHEHLANVFPNGLVVEGYISDPEVNPAGTMSLSVQDGYTALMDMVAQSATFNGDVQITNLSGIRNTTIDTPVTINNEVNIQTETGEGWTFNNDGYLLGPWLEDGRFLNVHGIVRGTGEPLLISSSDSVLINGTNGEFLNFHGDPNNQIATIGDINEAVSDAIQGNTVRYSPNFTATGLAFTGTGTTYPTYNSYYVKNGKMVSFVIEVDCSTVTNFGTGQYKLQLPFTPAIGFNHFSGWAQIDIAVNPDVTNGHVILNVDHAGITDVLDLHYLKQAGGAHTPIIEGLFLQGTPVTLTTSSKIYVNGTYICQ